MKKLLKSKISLILLPFALIALAYGSREVYIAFLMPFAGECVFNKLTGYYCPGCGNTRAVLALMSGRFLKSLGYNPMPMLLLCTAAIHYILTLRGKKPFLSNALIITIMSAMLAYYILRNFIPLSPYLPPK